MTNRENDNTTDQIYVNGLWEGVKAKASAQAAQVLETTVKAVNLFIVPRFFVVSKIADPDGLEWFSIISTPNTIFTHLAGSSSVWKALSPSVLQAAFNVDPEVEQLFRSKRTADAIFFPPPN
ncbi:Glutelin type-A 2 [Glycine max]|nr:Glutelin type-A 2 [Glycine max]